MTKKTRSTDSPESGATVSTLKPEWFPENSVIISVVDDKGYGMTCSWPLELVNKVLTDIRREKLCDKPAEEVCSTIGWTLYRNQIETRGLVDHKQVEVITKKYSQMAAMCVLTRIGQATGLDDLAKAISYAIRLSGRCFILGELGTKQGAAFTITPNPMETIGPLIDAAQKLGLPPTVIKMMDDEPSTN